MSFRTGNNAIAKRSRRQNIASRTKNSHHSTGIKIHFEPASALLRRIRFQLKAPHAQYVKLAADFTAWDGLPVDMKRNPEGKWVTTIPLTPGDYEYRFIVDGQWSDDPFAANKAPNPFGTSNAIREVI